MSFLRYLILCGLVVVILVASIIGIRAWKRAATQRELDRLLRPGPAAIVKSCRNLLAASGLDALDEAYWRRGAVTLTRDAGLRDERIPAVVREMDPALVIIESNVVQVVGNVPRASLLVFAEGTPEHGSRMITNGLWVWYGDR